MRRDRGTESFIEEVRQRVRPILNGMGVNPASVACTVECDGPHLTVHFSGPTLDQSARQAIGVRVLGALSALGHTVGDVDIVFDEGQRSLQV
jgi:hypothetical protein